MELPLCRICNQRHRLGGCPSFETKKAVDGGPTRATLKALGATLEKKHGRSGPSDGGSEPGVRRGVQRGKADDQQVPGKKARAPAKAKAGKARKASADVPGRAKKRGQGKKVAARAGDRVAHDQLADRIPSLAAAPKVGRPLAGERDKTLAATEPWKAAGISRAKYFRDKKAAAEKA